MAAEENGGVGVESGNGGVKMKIESSGDEAA
jgi:hypothetical protein